MTKFSKIIVKKTASGDGSALRRASARALQNSRQGHNGQNEQNDSSNQIENQNITHASSLITQTANNQDSIDNINPQDTTIDLDLSSPGTTKGNTIEPKNSWPAATNTSDSALSFDVDKNNFTATNSSINYKFKSRCHQDLTVNWWVVN